MKWSLKNKKIPKHIDELKTIIFDNRVKKVDEKEFFNPTHPLELSLKDVGIDEKNLKLVIKRILKAKKNQEYIVIFGDYDADGVCATAILWQTLYEMGCNVKPFIPHRKNHGYGVSVKAIDAILADKKPDLVITVDNGIVALEPIEYLKSKNVDVIITDHHQPEMKDGKPIFPKADYILHTSKLCGATVSWMLAREIEATDNSKKKLATESLDLCGLATIADQVKLLGANRSFAKFGIEAMRKTKRVGLKLLFDKTIKDIAAINSDTVGYAIAPRINAMGRMGDGIVALRFLCTKSKSQAEKLVDILIETNDERKSLTYELLNHAEKQIELIKEENILIVHSELYHEGILGLIAGAMLEKHSKPSIAISMGKKFAKASVRSVPGVNIVEFLRTIRDDLIEVGGHPMAAGFGFDPNKLEKIKTRLFALAKKEISVEMLVKEIESECILPPELFNDMTAELVESFEPFGQGNRRPLFEFRDLEIIEIVSMGNEGGHLRISLRSLGDGESGNGDSKGGSSNARLKSIKAIGWRMGSLVDEYEPGDKVSVIGSLEFNDWNGRKYLQLILKDIKKQSKA
ncbi:MAG: single-stranded-DNA-specific exonuclease RecJ [Candidatus Pacebacteria bacterium CG_4_10_14_3_um_filter_34_15]|nr:single-stranded-DNA-specific exonuclease RecJ [Candidatus Pacearchaeota archaeon]NCQ65625.1 single-stranded-DNA-specific exonuclease RecJ [Candidatus Paceibacterota bacterium]OIO44920.1 MAG: single-stranded-DNA-specific exonuclease RecJ [Candidatus Pacebacteria bacterium CG1_02_43_31]PIQ80549.1 MAG: single-stranded-DNA-specific exonuclease RecJ [Candidatus Pacebacteria bacterium CG11_big_fil_rev_8_21_14_0_20_34_55]PIX81595.1 MAG: single-stranded-DNA-specific exonuclease RecJ [Candidatus Pace